MTLARTLTATAVALALAPVAPVIAQDAETAPEAEARAAMRSAVEDADGITLDEYVSISEAARDDEALNQRVMNRLSEQATQE